MFLSGIQSSGVSVGESFMSSSSIMTRSSSDEESLSCPSSCQNYGKKKGASQVSGPGLKTT